MSSVIRKGLKTSISLARQSMHSRWFSFFSCLSWRSRQSWMFMSIASRQSWMPSQVMIDYMYGKFPTLRGAEEICELFEIVDLAERFKVCANLRFVQPKIKVSSHGNYEQLSSTTLKMKCMVVTVFSKRSLALRKSTGQQCSFTSGRLANTKRWDWNYPTTSFREGPKWKSNSVLTEWRNTNNLKRRSPRPRPSTLWCYCKTYAFLRNYYMYKTYHMQDIWKLSEIIICDAVRSAKVYWLIYFRKNRTLSQCLT